MKRWLPAFLLVVLACLPLLLGHARDPSLLEDSDTRVALAAIRERQSPLSWFTGDWPLENHFYRPISTLTFEADLAISGDAPAGYGRTNALLAAASILLLFWFVLEWLGRPWSACGSALLFALWHHDVEPDAFGWVFAVGLGLALVGAIRRFASGERSMLGMLGPPTLAALLGLVLASELGGVSYLSYRMLGWIPGRTASTMTVFVLVCLAATARYLRLTRIPSTDEARFSTRLDRPTVDRLAGLASPLDLPATRGTTRSAPSRRPWVWAVIALVALALALGSYEQAVMVPAMMLVLALTSPRRPGPMGMVWPAAAWLVLGGYLALRAGVVPTSVSTYQTQQFRFGEGAWIALTNYLIPAWTPLWSAWHSLAAVGVDAFLIGTVQRGLLALASNVAIVVAAWKDRDGKALLAAWLLSVLAFLPMAFLKPFDHYHYLPMAMRAVFVVLLIQLTLRWWLTAVALPARQAPPRPRPEFGSPLRP